ncbi:MAG: hypothetical protein HY326_14555, partial [Chloroflexi bacterium]|nr:hypothetical protein [Chloroflexota bacterium]
MLGRPSALRLIFGIVGLSFVGFVLVMGMPVRAQGPDNGKGPHPARLEGVPILTIGNDLIEADLDSFGGFIIGTRAGDPNNNDDDHKDLLYGFFIKDIFSSYASLHVVGGPKEGIYKLQSNAPAQPPVLVNGDSAFTFWTLNGVRVEQTLTPAFNPFTNRDDTVRIQYRLTNVYTATLQAGIRSMLDVQVGMNDGAPYLVPNVGQVTREREYDRAHMPPFWKAFESAQFDPGSVKGLGILSGFGATTPDRFVIARWGRPSEQNGIGLYPASWTYDVDPNATVQQDSAVAMYW